MKRAKGITKNVLMVNFDPEEEQRRAAQEWEDFKKNRDNFNYGCVRYPARDKRSIINDCGFREVSSIMSDFAVDDPYEICFALVYLTEKGDESPWLFRTGYAVMHTACSMLPWFGKTEDDFDNPLTYFRSHGVSLKAGISFAFFLQIPKMNPLGRLLTNRPKWSHRKVIIHLIVDAFAFQSQM